uniref:Exostosin domain-containing protein n=1 Tax=Bursaphelenchus xylophilus TaxID=6326 RepID=A0A1I7S5N0_BURXY
MLGLGFHFLLCLGLTALLLLVYNGNLEKDAARTTTGHAYLPTERWKFQNKSFSKRITENKCFLPALNPWDPSILKYLNPQSALNKTCKPTYPVRSYFIKNTLRVNTTMGSNEHCFYRCVISIHDHLLQQGQWIKINETSGNEVNCDVTEVKCKMNETDSYHFAHVNLVEKKRGKIGPNPVANDVYLIILDSVSSNTFRRAFQSTKQYLEQEHSAVFFPYLNRVGVNSRPNNYGFLLNERAEDLPASPWNPFSGEGLDRVICNRSVMEYNYIGKDFQKTGYRTMIDTDWFYSLFESPNCTGFGMIPTDHYIHTYELIVDSDSPEGDKNLSRNIHKGACVEPHHRPIKTLQQFANLYPNEPKFSITSFVMLGHDDTNNVFRGDKDFKRFFEDMSDKIMAFVSENNPFLMVSVPQKLRMNNDFMTQLRENAKKLVTHYDIYATLLEIGKNNHGWTESTLFSTSAFTTTGRKLKGSSLFHPLSEPRDCHSLLIPFQYCICQRKQWEVQNRELALQVGQMMVQRINQDVMNSPYSSVCHQLVLNQESGYRVIQFEPKEDVKEIYLIQIEVVSGAKYQGYAGIKDGHLRLYTTTFPRMNTYAKQAWCIPEQFLRHYCLCQK